MAIEAKQDLVTNSTTENLLVERSFRGQNDLLGIVKYPILTEKNNQVA